ncbi:hypothetical protein PVAND_008155 [Polypedilum vanderplanki]|uniref:Serine/threonine-protein phosphatase 4 regulatory subunit 2 n=1 Tax=Polypedilum vanderplanki TaxID=319348 RepID=A0A9J6CA40_POLVA|nr:hypothetical protein PVAND_008155 [Polypedilum vanderplanki]
MDQPEEVLEKLERFNVQKNPEITRELDEYVSFVARTGESVFNWALVKRLYREKLINVITEFNEASAKEIPTYPNVDPFNYETMKKMLIERLDSFNAAPFTIQRISELLSDPRKQYSRIDKFMRAVEKNILVVSTVSPGRNRSEESENGDSLDSVGLNGDFSSDVNVDIDMENDKNDNDNSLNTSKETNSPINNKENDITATEENLTTKKTDTKEETNIDAAAIESIEPIQVNVAVEPQSAETIGVCEPIQPSVSGEEREDISKSTDSNEQKTIENNEEINDGVIKLNESTPAEPKIDEDALLNEPLRPADDDEEILNTTPLAALENIVANRTVIDEKPRIEEQLQQKSEEQSVIEQTSDEQVEQIDKSENNTEDSIVAPKQDDSEIEIKRRKLNTEEVIDSATKEVINTEVSNEKSEQIDESLNTSEKSISIPIVENISDEQPQSQDESVVEKKSEEMIAPIDESVQIESITEKEVPVSIQSDTVEENEITSEHQQPVVENEQEDEMEATSIVENSMALDDDVNVQVEHSSAEMEITPLAAASTTTMDTDNDAENALEMDIDDDEPMDQ